MSVPYADFLKECAEIAEQRGEKYGDVVENFEHTACICYLVFGIEITPIQITQVLRAVKMSREKFAHQPDNILDDINYAAIGLDIRNRNSSP